MCNQSDPLLLGSIEFNFSAFGFDLYTQSFLRFGKLWSVWERSRVKNRVSVIWSCFHYFSVISKCIEVVIKCTVYLKRENYEI